MARYTGAVCRLCRREGMKLFLKGERCYTEKCAVEKRPEQSPGEHGHKRSKFSEFGIRLREKQKVKRIYNLTERQFNKYFKEASRQKGVTGDILISLLERRLDNVVFRLGFSSSRREGREIVRHGHIFLNAERVDIPSYLVKVGDRVEVAEGSRGLERINRSLDILARRGIPEWLDLERENYRGLIKRFPAREDVISIPIEEQLIVEFYSRV